jgi:chorismate synthase
MNTFGIHFRISIFGESHGQFVGITIDGCPPGIPIQSDDFTSDIIRRKSGAMGTTPRIENDEPNIISGVHNGYSTGAPLTILFRNENIQSKDYSNLIDTPRPGHADFVAHVKYKGFADRRGGGHFSGRLTLPLVASGVIAKKICKGLNFQSRLIEAGGMKDIDAAIQKAIADNNSIGGIVECRVANIPIGLGEPFFNSVESVISHLAFSVPAIKGIEFGSGFQAARMTGIEHNDALIAETGQTLTNNAGGIVGGISNGNELIFRVAVKPTSSISKQQQTFNLKTKQIETLEVKGRHDVCIALRVPVVIEAIAAIALADFILSA